MDHWLRRRQESWPRNWQAVFNPSEGWLDCFKHRHNIVYKQFHGEAADADLSGKKDFLQKWPGIQKEYTNEQIWNADKSVQDAAKFHLTFQSWDHCGRKSSGRQRCYLFYWVPHWRKETFLCHQQGKKAQVLQEHQNLSVHYSASNLSWMALVWRVAVGVGQRAEEKRQEIYFRKCPVHSPMPKLSHLRVKYRPKTMKCVSATGPWSDHGIQGELLSHDQPKAPNGDGEEQRTKGRTASQGGHPSGCHFLHQTSEAWSYTHSQELLALGRFASWCGPWWSWAGSQSARWLGTLCLWMGCLDQAGWRCCRAWKPLRQGYY